MPKEYSSIPLKIYEDNQDFECVEVVDISALILQYYAEKDVATRIRQKSVDLRKIVQTALERNVRKLDLQTKQLADSEKKDKYRVYGELLTVYGYSAKEGDKSITVNDYNTGEDVTIPLDPTLSPNQNAKK